MSHISHGGIGAKGGDDRALKDQPPRSIDPEPRGSQYRRLHPNALSVWQVGNIAGGIFLIVVALSAFHSPFTPASWRRWELLALATIAALTLFDMCVITPRRYKSYRYALLDDCIVIVHGSVLSRHIIFPLHQLLYAETRQGPILRHYGLFQMRIGTIAEPHSFGPLTEAVAEEIQSTIEARHKAE